YRLSAFSLTKENITKLALFAAPIFFLLFVFKNYMVIIGAIILSSLVMFHKKYLSIVLGIDICLMMTLLVSSRYGSITGAMVGGLSYLLGMLISLEITKSPMVTMYGTVFYVVIGMVGAIIPMSLIYSIPLVLIVIFNILFGIGAFFIGAPVDFLAKYAVSNIIANLLFIRIFGGLLRVMF
ncbi:MAG: hypothetical protein NDI94_05180, partial [Candidatus Woesearchaeota archaeon]|nr:hypothetical protein [Candidatus Woesearchaeota archaeon]